MASLAGTVRWWEKVEEPTTVWQALLTDDGLEYYVNTKQMKPHGRNQKN